jgi:hypothetical protein
VKKESLREYTTTTLGVHFEADRLFVMAYLEVDSPEQASQMLDAGLGLSVQKTGIAVITQAGRTRQIFDDDAVCGCWAKKANRHSHECYVDALLPFDSFVQLCTPGLTFKPTQFNVVTYDYRGAVLKGFRLVASGDIGKPVPHLQCSTLRRRTG